MGKILYIQGYCYVYLTLFLLATVFSMTWYIKESYMYAVLSLGLPWNVSLGIHTCLKAHVYTKKIPVAGEICHDLPLKHVA